MKPYLLSAAGGAAGAAALTYFIAKHDASLQAAAREAEKQVNYELAKQRSASVAEFSAIHKAILFSFLAPAVIATLVGGWRHGLVALGTGVAAEAATLKSLGYFQFRI